jgi:hypothetical protein
MMLTTLGVSALDALSGLASSRKHPGVIYAHNDHDRPNVYALNMSGQLLTRYDLDVSATDTEDIAVGSCPAGSCVYFADIGDNAAARASYAVYRFAEPDVPATPSDQHQNVAFERFPFMYEDGSHNAEGLFVAPDGSAIYIVTKPASGAASVYRIAQPYLTTGMNRAVKAADLPIPSADDEQTSAAAGHPCGLGFLVRTYNKVYEFRIAHGMPFESAFGVQPSVAAMPDEMQSEGIDYFPDGRGFVSSGEGRSAPVMATRCR